MRAGCIFCIVITGLTMLVSCKPKPQLQEAVDADLTVQVMQLKDAPDDDGTLSYQARLIPNKKLLETKTNDEKTALYYEMDSCFYMVDGNKKIYASLVQPIANGINGNYEYLLQFDVDKLQNAINGNMVYQDKHITKRTYKLKITQ